MMMDLAILYFVKFIKIIYVINKNYYLHILIIWL